MQGIYKHVAQKIINYNNIVYNLKVLKTAAGGAKICAVIKNDAYGHGMLSTAEKLMRHADYFAVAFSSEAQMLLNEYKRQHSSVIPSTAKRAERVRWLTKESRRAKACDEALPKILILTPNQPFIDDIRVEYVVTAIAQIKKLAKINCNFKIGLHLKIDTGMGRFGFSSKQAFCKAVHMILRTPNLCLKGICTHFAESENAASAAQQKNCFNKFLAAIQAAGLNLPKDILIHMANTGGVSASCKNQMVRLGIGLYGYGVQGLKPAMQAEARVVEIRHLKKGAPLGYNAAHICSRPTKAAVIDVGYGNGFFRAFSCGVGEVIILGRRCRIIGNICMNSTLVDVTGLKSVRTGTRAVILGEELSAACLAKKIGTIPYEILCSFGNFVQRKH